MEEIFCRFVAERMGIQCKMASHEQIHERHVLQSYCALRADEHPVENLLRVIYQEHCHREQAEAS